jgi:hypothetical protein
MKSLARKRVIGNFVCLHFKAQAEPEYPAGTLARWGGTSRVCGMDEKHGLKVPD